MVERIDRIFHDNGISCSVPVPGLALTLWRGSTAPATQWELRRATEPQPACRAWRARSRDFLPHVFGYDSVQHPKPAPDIVIAFSKAIARPTRARSSVIGDNPHDIEMARNAGAGAAIGRADRKQRSRRSRAARRCGARKRLRSSRLAAPEGGTPLEDRKSRFLPVRLVVPKAGPPAGRARSPASPVTGVAMSRGEALGWETRRRR